MHGRWLPSESSNSSSASRSRTSAGSVTAAAGRATAAAAGGGSISGPLEVLSAMATRVKVFSPSEDQISKDQTLYASV